MLIYLAFRLFAFVARTIPQRWGQALACRLGGLIYRVSPLAEAGRDNFQHVLGPSADPDLVSLTAKRAFEQRTLNYFEMVSASNASLDHIDWRSKIHGLDELERVIAEKRGVILTAAHLGPMEYMIQGITALPYEMIGIQEQLENERVHEYLIGLRSAHGFEMLSTQGPLLEVYRRVKRGAVLLTAVDRDSTGTGLITEFFGAPAWVPDGYARLAVRAGVPVIFGYPWRTADGAECQVFPPIYPELSLPKEEAVQDLVNRTLRLLEQAIRAHPWEWHLSTPIWQLAQEKLAMGARR
jgi:lauroyl/myristoyl acyltransferase